MNILYGSRDRDGKEGDFRIIAMQLPSCGLLLFVPLKCDRCVLTVARGDDDGRAVEKPVVCLPVVWRGVDPFLIAIDDKSVQSFKAFEIEVHSRVISRTYRK